MTTTHVIGDSQAPHATGQEPGRLITRPLLIRFVSIAGTTTSFTCCFPLSLLSLSLLRRC